MILLYFFAYYSIQSTSLIYDSTVDGLRISKISFYQHNTLNIIFLLLGGYLWMSHWSVIIAASLSLQSSTIASLYFIRLQCFDLFSFIDLFDVVKQFCYFLIYFFHFPNIKCLKANCILSFSYFLQSWRHHQGANFTKLSLFDMANQGSIIFAHK